MMPGDEEFVDLCKIAEENTITIYVNDFTEESFREFRSDMIRAEKTGQTIIPIMIDSYGGSTDALFAMLDMVNSAKLPVATIGVGKVMSCGVVLLSAGDKGKRYLSPLARLMIHEISLMAEGKNEELQSTAIESNRVNEVMLDVLDANCDKQLGYWASHLKDAKNADLFLTARQAKNHGLIDIISLPRITAEVKSRTKLV